MTKPISDKQEQFLRDNHKRITLISGSVRSGKTYISLVAFALFVASMSSGSSFIMVGKTVTALKRNCLNLLADLVGDNNFSFSSSQKSGLLFGRRVWLEGANDERSESKIRGMTLAGAYCDELTLFPNGFYNMLLSRLSVTGAKLFATTNPDSPEHWVKKDIIDNAKIQAHFTNWHFTLDDNDFLDAEYCDSLKREYSGVFYDRYILGKWVKAEGLVYPMFDRLKHIFTDKDAPQSGEWFISIDYGIQNPFSAGLWCIYGGVAYRMAEYYYDGRKDGQRTDEEHADAVMSLAGKHFIRKYIIDPSAASFIACMRKRVEWQSIIHANNEVIPGISNVASALKQNRMMIHESCKDIIREFGLYSWDDKSKDDKPVKDKDHGLDDARYLTRTVLRKLIPSIEAERR